MRIEDVDVLYHFSVNYYKDEGATQKSKKKGTNLKFLYTIGLRSCRWREKGFQKAAEKANELKL